MKKVKVSFTVMVPEEATYKEIEHWVEFEIGANGHLHSGNCLSDKDMEADRDSVRIEIEAR